MDDEKAKAASESHQSSAAAFVEGGVQDACDDSCSICLEPFCDSDPSTVTGCKHEFHLQCILEWCQRSSQCPMCWQSIVLKDPTSQELLETVERERSIRSNQPRSTAIFHHPTLGEFELQHLPVGANDSDLEERIIQHLAAAAAMGRTHHFTRREGRGRSGGHGRPQFLVFSTHPNAPPVGSMSVSSSQTEGENEPAPGIILPSSSHPVASTVEETPDQVPSINSDEVVQIATLPSGTSVTAASTHNLSNTRSSAGQSIPVNQDRAGSSDFQSFSESFKSRLSNVSMRYKESISKSARGWKEKLFSRNSPVADIGSEVRREVNAGIASVSRMMERLDTRENRRVSGPSGQHNSEGFPIGEPSNGRVAEDQTNTIAMNSTASTSCGTTSSLN